MQKNLQHSQTKQGQQQQQPYSYESFQKNNNLLSTFQDSTKPQPKPAKLEELPKSKGQGKEADHLNNNDLDNLDEPSPLLFVDVNIKEGQTSRITVRKGDTAPLLAASFAKEHNLDASLQEKLKGLLDQQIKNLLTNIEEEEEISENPNQFT